MSDEYPAPGGFWRRLFRAVLRGPDTEAVDPAVTERLREQAPVIWLLGKVQAGKTSIVRAVTGNPYAEVGAAFRPCTRHSRVYDFPEDAPVVRFLDTRGLGEVDYDPAEDLALVEGRAHAVVAVARATDPSQEAVLDALVRVRRRHPDWPVVLVQTRLHDAYPDGREHPPYEQLTTTAELADLRRALTVQRERFAALPGKGPFRAVPVDLTRDQDGFADTDYGLEALLEALDEACSEGRATLIRELARAERDVRLQRLRPSLIAYASAAGVGDLVPLAAFVTVPALQGRMLQVIARHYGLKWDRRTLRRFVTSLGTGTALGIGAGFSARQLAKLVPVYGQLVGAAAAGVASAAVTYALGRAACHYLEQLRAGREDPQGVADAYRGSLREAYRMFRREDLQAAGPEREGPTP